MINEWTEQQVRILIDRYATDALDDIRQEIGHPISSIYIKASKLGLKREFKSRALHRFMTKFAISDKEFNGTPCWEWVGATSDGGYGQFKFNKKREESHRWAYEYFVGPIPDEFEIDHLCRNRPCVNILHLEAVTRKENVLRGMSPTAQNARKTHCKRGHELTLDNVKIKKDGNRRCTICDRLRNQRNIL